MPLFIDYLKRFLSWHYFEGAGEAFQAVVTKPIDQLIAAAKEAVVARFYRYAPDGALPYLLQNYNLDWVERFIPAQRRQQVADAWDTWEKAGTEEGIVAEVRRLGYSIVGMMPVWLYRQSSDGITDTLQFQPSLQPDSNPLFHPTKLTAPRDIATEGEWGAREWWIDLNFHASSFFVVIHDPPFAFRRWGDPVPKWGAPARWDALVTGDPVALRRIYTTIKKFTGAEWSCRGVVFSYSGRYKLAPAQLTGVAVRTTFDAWACGLAGYITRWDGTKWTQAVSGTTANLAGVFIKPDTETAYIVGQAGTILRWTGTTWVAETSGILTNLSGFAYAGLERWACGQGGVILFDVGLGWTPSTSGVATDLRRMLAFSRTDIWAIGVGGVALHWDGASWTSTTTGVTGDLNGIWGRAPNDVWAVGAGGTIIHWNGTAWSTVSSPTAAGLFSVYGLPDGRAVATGQGGIVLAYNNIVWALAVGNLNGESADTVHGTIADNFWAVTQQGTAYHLTAAGVVYAGAVWNGFTWDDGTKYTLNYVIKWRREKWE